MPKRKRKSDIHRKKTKSGDRLKFAKWRRRPPWLEGRPACLKVIAGDGADGPPGSEDAHHCFPRRAQGTDGPGRAGGDTFTSGQTEEGRSCDQTIRAPGTGNRDRRAHTQQEPQNTGSGPAPKGKETAH